jgi:hypothetical protein
MSAQVAGQVIRFRSNLCRQLAVGCSISGSKPEGRGFESRPRYSRRPRKGGVFLCSRGSEARMRHYKLSSKIRGTGRCNLALALLRRGSARGTSPHAAPVPAGLRAPVRQGLAGSHSRSRALQTERPWARSRLGAPPTLRARHIAPDMIIGTYAGWAQRRLHRLPAADGRGGLSRREAASWAGTASRCGSHGL